MVLHLLVMIYGKPVSLCGIEKRGRRLLASAHYTSDRTEVTCERCTASAAKMNPAKLAQWIAEARDRTTAQRAKVTADDAAYLKSQEHVHGVECLNLGGDLICRREGKSEAWLASTIAAHRGEVSPRMKLMAAENELDRARKDGAPASTIRALSERITMLERDLGYE